MYRFDIIRSLDGNTLEKMNLIKDNELSTDIKQALKRIYINKIFNRWNNDRAIRIVHNMSMNDIKCISKGPKISVKYSLRVKNPQDGYACTFNTATKCYYFTHESGIKKSICVVSSDHIIYANPMYRYLELKNCVLNSNSKYDTYLFLYRKNMYEMIDKNEKTIQYNISHNSRAFS